MKSNRGFLLSALFWIVIIAAFITIIVKNSNNPREDYDTLVEKYDALSERYDSLLSKYDDLYAVYGEMIDNYHHLEIEHSHYYAIYEEIGRLQEDISTVKWFFEGEENFTLDEAKSSFSNILKCYDEIYNPE